MVARKIDKKFIKGLHPGNPLYFEFIKHRQQDFVLKSTNSKSVHSQMSRAHKPHLNDIQAN